MGAFNRTNNTVAGIKLAYPRPTDLDRFGDGQAAFAVEDSNPRVEIVKPLSEQDAANPAPSGDIGHMALDGLGILRED